MSGQQTSALTATVDSLLDHLATETPLGRLRAIAALRADLAGLEAVAVAAARDPARSGIYDGWSRRARAASWQEVADALGVTRSAAWQRFHGACLDCGSTDGHERCGDAVEF